MSAMTLHFWFFQHALWIFHFALVFIFLAHILRQRKAPASTFAWFLFVLIAPYIGLPFYFTFGFRKFLPSKPLIFGRPSCADFVIVDPVQKTLTASGSPLPCSNAEFQLLDSGEKAFHAIVNAIGEARRSICLETYIFGRDAVGVQILSLLAKRAGEGLDVRILIDTIGSHLPGHPNFREFERAGGQVAFFMPMLHRPFRGNSNLRNHRKQMIIDGQVGIMGGMNIAEEYMGPNSSPSRWIDIAFTVQGKIAGQMEEVFYADWNYAVSKNEQPRRGESTASERGCLVQLVVSGPDVATDPIYEFLLIAIYGARERVWIATPYFVPDEALAKAMELACRRGVDLRLFIPKKSNHFIADLCRSTYVQQIQNAGGHIFLSPKMLHAKATLIDSNYAFVGSANLDGRSLLLNYELGLCLYSAAEVEAIETWFNSTMEICVKGFPRLNWLEELTGNLARLTGPLI